MSKNHQQRINKYFPNRGIWYQPGLSIAFSSINVGLMLSQLLYWHELGVKKDGWIYKTMKEMKAETGLTRTQQETAIRICLEHDIFEYKLGGIPAKRHFKLNMSQLENLLPALKKETDIVYPNPPRQFVENQQTNTKITHETTSINTNKNLKKSKLSSIGEELNNKYGSLLDAKKSNDFGKNGATDE